MTDKDVLLKLLMDRPVAYHADLAKAVGSVTAGLFLSQMLYWTGKGSAPEGWIYKKQAEFYEETGLGRYEQETARKVLRKAKVLHEERRGIPAVNYYKIDLDELVKVLRDYYESKHHDDGHEPGNPIKSRLGDSSILECGNPANNNDGFQQTKMMDSSIHTTTEITTEITTGSNNNNNKRSDNRPQQKDAPQAPSALDILELVEYAGRQGQEIDRHQAIDMIQMAGSLDAAKSRVDAISAPDKISRSGVHDKFVSK